MDKASWSGVLLGLIGIVGGLLLEGGSVSQILQPTAAMIVFGGTLGAILLQFPLPVVFSAFRRLAHVFFEPNRDPREAVRQLVHYANQARRNGIVSLDAELEDIQDLFMKKCLMLAVDGTEPQELRKMMELELDHQSEYEEKIPQVFESAGGFSPPSALLARCWGSFKSCSIWTKLMKWAGVSPWPSWRPSTVSARPTWFCYPPPVS